jgi:hypothetical protein
VGWVGRERRAGAQARGQRRQGVVWPREVAAIAPSPSPSSTLRAPAVRPHELTVDASPDVRRVTGMMCLCCVCVCVCVCVRV